MEKRVKNGLDGILKKSSKLMAMRGFRGTSMRDLAEATDRSLAGLYHYFKNKEELLYLINYRGFRTLLEAAERINRRDWRLEEKLYTLIYNHIYYFSIHLDEMRVMMLGTQDLDSKHARLIKSLKTKYAEAVFNVVNAYVREKNPGPFSEKALTRKTYLLFGMLNWIFGWYSSKKHGSDLDLVNDNFQMFSTGVLATTSDISPDIGARLSHTVRNGL